MSKTDDTILDLDLDLDLDTVTGGQSHIPTVPSHVTEGKPRWPLDGGSVVGAAGRPRPLGETIHKPISPTDMLRITGGAGPAAMIQRAGVAVRNAADAAIEATKIKPYLPNPNPDNLPKLDPSSTFR